MPKSGPDQDAGELQWYTIDSFQPGIFSQQEYFPPDANALSAPEGAAQEIATYGCVADQSGALVPGPGLVYTLNPISDHVVFGTNNFISGFVVGNINNQDELVYSTEAVDGADLRYFWLDSAQFWNSSQQAITSLGPTACTNTAFYSSVWYGMTRLNPDYPYEVPGMPCLVVTYFFTQSDGGGTYYIWTYPDIAAPGTFSVYQLSNSTPVAGLILYSNRVIIPVYNVYEWTSSSTNVTTNEEFNFTDPPNSPVMGSQQEVFIWEDPVGVGAWGSVSVGELMCIKQSQGGFIVYGDISNPSSVVWLPGVQPTYGMMNRACTSSVGLVYASFNHGVWAWNGSNSSTKLSTQLRDDFYFTQATSSNASLLTIGQQVVSTVWGRYVFVTNNWLFDLELQSWWRLSNPSAGNFTPTMTFSGVGINGEFLYTFPTYINDNTEPIAYRWDLKTRTGFYQWLGHPIPESTERIISVREIAIRLQGTGTVEVTTVGIGDAPSSVTFTVASNDQPVLFRGVVNTHAHDVTVQIVSTGSGDNPAPMVYPGLAVGYRTAQETNAT